MSARIASSSVCQRVTTQAALIAAGLLAGLVLVGPALTSTATNSVPVAAPCARFTYYGCGMWPYTVHKNGQASPDMEWYDPA